MHLLLIIVSAVLINNFVLVQFLGICPFLGVTRKVETAIGMGAAVIFVMTLASAITYVVQYAILEKFNIPFLQTIAFILVIAALVQFVELVLKKTSPSLYQALGVYLPLITTNCAVLGVAILNINYNYNFIESVIFGAAAAAGFTLALILFACIRERMEYSPIPKALEGFPIALISAALMSIAFMGFSGLI